QGILPLKHMEEDLASSHKHFTHTSRTVYLAIFNIYENQQSFQTNGMRFVERGPKLCVSSLAGLPPSFY
ncbi:hypothetical protein, partial [Anoxybacteroides voinovskiense]